MSAAKDRKGHKMVKGPDVGLVKQKKKASTQGRGVQESGEKKHKMKPGSKVRKHKN